MQGGQGPYFIEAVTLGGLAMLIGEMMLMLALVEAKRRSAIGAQGTPLKRLLGAMESEGVVGAEYIEEMTFEIQTEIDLCWEGP